MWVIWLLLLVAFFFIGAGVGYVINLLSLFSESTNMILGYVVTLLLILLLKIVVPLYRNRIISVKEEKEKAELSDRIKKNPTYNRMRDAFFDYLHSLIQREKEREVDDTIEKRILYLYVSISTSAASLIVGSGYGDWHHLFDFNGQHIEVSREQCKSMEPVLFDDLTEYLKRVNDIEVYGEIMTGKEYLDYPSIYQICISIPNKRYIKPTKLDF